MKRTPKVTIDYTGWTEEQHLEYLRTHPAYLAEYEKYDADSIEPFIKWYAQRKHIIMNDKDWYQEEAETQQTWPLELADKFIDMILQKKLFHLQCQWRAELIQLPLIKLCSDFKYWETNVRDCPFIPPITQEELDLCMQYFREQIEVSDIMENYPEDWQNYKEFKNQQLVSKYEEDEDKILPPIELPHTAFCTHPPNFYLFFDEHQGTSDLMALPDKRFKKEEVYRNESVRLQMEKIKTIQTDEKLAEPETTPTKPVLHPWNSELIKFIEAVEDEAVKETFERYFDYEDRQEDEMDEDYLFLKQIPEPVQMIGNEDWRLSMKLSVLYYKQSKALEVLPYVYETYLMAFDEDMPLEQLIAERTARYKYNTEDFRYELMNILRKRFLDCREAVTGLRDFDF